MLMCLRGQKFLKTISLIYMTSLMGLPVYGMDNKGEEVRLLRPKRILPRGAAQEAPPMAAGDARAVGVGKEAARRAATYASMLPADSLEKLMREQEEARKKERRRHRHKQDRRMRAKKAHAACSGIPSSAEEERGHASEEAREGGHAGLTRQKGFPDLDKEIERRIAVERERREVKRENEGKQWQLRALRRLMGIDAAAPGSAASASAYACRRATRAPLHRGGRHAPAAAEAGVAAHLSREGLSAEELKILAGLDLSAFAGVIVDEVDWR